MSRALSVYHGRFGRATLYELNRPMTTHAHREGHLIFYLDGAPASASVNGKLCGLTERSAIAVSPWEPHGFNPGDRGASGIFLVLYIDPSWFQRMGHSAHALPAHALRANALLKFGRPEIELTPRIQAIMREVVSLLEEYDTAENFDGTLFELTDACFEQSWRLAGGWQRYCGPASSFIDFRVRKSIVLMSEKLGSEIELDEVARDAGLSRPHFYKLFRRQTGVTPNIYLNTLRMEKAVQRLGQTSQSITEIGYELGFSCQSVFTRFFSSHVGMAPTDYRRAVQVLNG
jgi:AraC-like DNA-binding protein